MVAIVHVATPVAHTAQSPLLVRYSPTLQEEQENEFRHI